MKTVYPELIILDIEMPIMSGLEFLKAFHNSFFMEKNNTSIVFLSNHSSDAQKSLLSHQDFLTLEKPLEKQQIDVILDYHFNIASRKREQAAIKKLYAKAG